MAVSQFPLFLSPDSVLSWGNICTVVSLPQLLWGAGWTINEQRHPLVQNKAAAKLDQKLSWTSWEFLEADAALIFPSQVHTLFCEV